MKKFLAVALMGMLFTASFVFAEEAATTSTTTTTTTEKATVKKDTCEPGKIPAKKHKKHRKHRKAMKNMTCTEKKAK